MAVRGRGLHEDFARFAENPSRESFREFLRNNVGEVLQCDFKEDWPSFPRLARHLLGFGNSGGGCIIIGIAEREDKTLNAKGLDKLSDKTEVFNGIKKFLPYALLPNVDILNFTYEASEYPAIIGKKFQVVFVEDDPKHLPFVACTDGDGIRNNAIYVRRGTSTEEANYEEVQQLINRRIDTGYSTQREIDLQTHLEQLKILFRQVERYHVRTKGGIFDEVGVAARSGLFSSALFGQRESVPNPRYPKEDLEAFIVRMIERKKRRIEIELDVANL